MAALCPGVHYGLSSKENFSENKDLIFVKLTDSAFRAIEDYLKNQNKFNSNQNPTIKFAGSEGHLSFPSFHNGYTSFNFSLSNTTDMEGPGGSFECMQQLTSSRGALEALGAVPYKMRIHANEDIYEATRHRMTVAEENHKNKCTREIKPNQTDIGRKVKVKQAIRASAIPSYNRDVSSVRDNSIKLAHQSNVSLKPPVNNSNSGYVNGLGNSLINNSRSQNKPSTPDIAKRPIKERLIHLLALRPYKKPELYERLLREGLREKNSMTSILKQISCLKDNAYHLNRAMWNDVREDWPFYTESEKQILKRRKPQNLTPPGSSDGGSSGSGQSPTSTYPGSPPSMSSSKRPGYYDGADGLPTKRQRISHYRKPSEQIYRTPIENSNQRRPVTDSRDSSNMNPRSREKEVANDYSTTISNTYSNKILNDVHNLSEDEENQNYSCDSNRLGGLDKEKQVLDSNGGLLPNKENFEIEELANTTPNELLNTERIQENSLIDNKIKNDVILCNGKSISKEISNSKAKYENKNQSCWNNVVTSTTESSPDSHVETKIDTAVSRKDPSVESGFPDYLTEYTTIKNIEQRRRYKSDFNAHYAEYKQLHAAVEKVSRYFAELEEMLKQENTTSAKYKDIKKEIVRAYKENKQDLKHHQDKKRFIYLHDKLSHIKRLVLEYDESNGPISH